MGRASIEVLGRGRPGWRAGGGFASRQRACYRSVDTGQGICDDLCGNGVLDPFCCEDCDDGTRLDGDGCSATCRAQPCCVPQPRRCAADRAVPCDDAADCDRAGVGGLCTDVPCDTACGDGRLDPGCCEQCDDGRACYGYPERIPSDR